VIFGGNSLEHRESIRSTQLLYRHLKRHLAAKYTFRYFYITREHKWATARASERMARGKLPISNRATRAFADVDAKRVLELFEVDCVYNCMMGNGAGENGNIMGLADLLNKRPMIGCDSKASSVALDKRMAKRLARSAGIPVVPHVCADVSVVDDQQQLQQLMRTVGKRIGFPCFLKPTNLGTCFFAYRCADADELVANLREARSGNPHSCSYLIETFIDNREVRVFVIEDQHGQLRTNDSYVTQLNFKRLADNNASGSLFKDLDNDAPAEVRAQIADMARKVFRLFGMKDYARIDFFVERGSNAVYFNEANTAPFVGSDSIDFMKRDGLPYHKFLDMMIAKNLGRHM
jgi:D-alanine-D-alanine ligase